MAAGLREEHLPEVHLDLAQSSESLGWLCVVEGRFREAEQHWRRALKIRLLKLGDDHPDTDLTKFSLAVVLGFTERHHAETESLFNDVLAWREKNLGPDHVDTAYALLGLAMFQSQVSSSAESLQESLTKILRAGSIFSEYASTQPLAIAISEIGHSLILSSLGSRDESLAAAQSGLETARSLLGEQHTLVDMISLLVANEFARQGSTKQAMQLYNAALADLKNRGLESSYFAARNLEHLGHQTKDLTEREHLLQQSLRIYDEVIGHQTWRTAWCQSHLALCIHALGRTEEARDLLDDARGIFLQIRSEGRDTVPWIDSQISRITKR